MKQFYITEIVTKDKLIHQGLFFKPEKPGKKAILWIHGLTDNFYGDVRTFKVFAEECEKHGWGLASFNNRGHDIVASIARIDKTTAKGYTHFTHGSGVEKFIDCTLDIDAAITFLNERGFTEVILIGISTGANKACYYAGTQKDSRVIGIVLASPISDVAMKLKELGKTYKNIVKNLSKLVKTEAGKLQKGLNYMPITIERFLSLYEMDSPEDTFPYYQKNPKFTLFSKISKPLMIVMAGSDEYTDRPVGEIVAVYDKFQHSQNYKSVIIPGAFHSFGGKEKEFVKMISDWILTF